MSTDKKDLQVGDWILPIMPGIMELGEPPYQIENIDGKI